MIERTDSQLITEAAQLYTAKGWQVSSQTNDTVSLIKPKKWSGLLLILTVVGLIAGVIPGLIFGILALVDYAIKGNQSQYITAGQIRTGGIPTPPNPTLKTLVIVGVVLFVCTLIFFISLVAQGGLG